MKEKIKKAQLFNFSPTGERISISVENPLLGWGQSIRKVLKRSVKVKWCKCRFPKKFDYKLLYNTLDILLTFTSLIIV